MNTQPVFSNAGYVQPLEIRKGADFIISLTLFAGTDAEPLDLANVQSIKARLRKTDNTGAVDFGYTLAADTASGVVTLTLDNLVTDTLELSPTSKMAKANYDWTADVQMVTGEILPICYGPVKVIEGETQWP